MNVSRVLVIALAAALVVLLHRYARRAALPVPRQKTLIKAASAIRLISSAVIVLLLLWATAERAGAWPQPMRWAAWSAALLSALIGAANVLAGLWVLSPFAGVDPGVTIVAAGHRGRVVAYGMCWIELMTRNGWSMRLPYLRLIYEPLLVRGRERPRRVELAFERPHWSEEEIALLRQAAILAPYRDLTSPVGVVRQADVVTVHVNLPHAGAEPHVRHLLEQIISDFGASAAPSREKERQER